MIIDLDATYRYRQNNFRCLSSVLEYKRTSRQRRIKMALRNSTAYTSVVFGFIMLALTFGCIAAGAVAMSKLTDDVSSIGLWAAYVSQKIF